MNDNQKEYTRLKQLGIKFTMTPTTLGMTTQSVLDDTCGKLLQIYQVTAG